MVRNTLDKLKQIFHRRQYAYRSVFHPKNVYTVEVLADLARFCRSTESSFHSDPRLHALIEGRREVWLRIERYLKLTPEQVWDLHKGDTNV